MSWCWRHGTQRASATSSSSSSSSSSTWPTGAEVLVPGSRAILYWQPDASTNDFIRDDWVRVLTKVRHGLAHELSESDGPIIWARVPRASTHGPFGRSPSVPSPARSRAFALKPAFTLDLYERWLRSTPRGIAGRQPSSNRVLRLRGTAASSDSGSTKTEKSKTSGANSACASEQREELRGGRHGPGLRCQDFRSRIREFDEMGLTPRISRVNAGDLMPVRSTVVPGVPIQGTAGGDVGRQRPPFPRGVHAYRSYTMASAGAPPQAECRLLGPYHCSGVPAPDDWRRSDRSGSCIVWRSRRASRDANVSG